MRRLDRHTVRDTTPGETRQIARGGTGRPRVVRLHCIQVAEQQRRLLLRCELRPLRHRRGQLVTAAAAVRLLVRLRARHHARARRQRRILCAPATQLLCPTAALFSTASRWPRSRCDATVQSRASHAGIPRPARASRFPARRINCSERVTDDGSAVVVEICAATLWWTIVVLRDGRRCCSWRADVAQLVAHHLAKVRVAGSNPVIRSKVQWHQPQRWSGRVVRQRPAKPCTRVRFPSPPPTRFPARLAQRESASLTRKRSLVQSQYRAPRLLQLRRGI